MQKLHNEAKVILMGAVVVFCEVSDDGKAVRSASLPALTAGRRAGEAPGRAGRRRRHRRPGVAAARRRRREVRRARARVEGAALAAPLAET